ncbi:MAG: caspase family protein [Novosphingobium sp.]|nr:caspase family protein [Novosphingobium sp.]
MNKGPKRQSMRQRLLACAVALGVAGTGAAPAQAKDATDLLIVDCLLPPAVQRLGNNVTYLRARKAVKIPAGECRKRGGEYTESGAETYASLMKIWLPAANAGDPEAQTNLGEIFEKGKGGPVQPEVAAQWYRKAADAGYSRAQVNLGSLYERGLGVPKNQAQAMEWYRRASGLSAASLTYTPAVQSDEVARLQRERDSLAQQLAEERRKRKELEEGKTASTTTSASNDAALNLVRKPNNRPGRAPKGVKFGNYHALVIGNNDFQHIPKLDTAVTDAQEIASLLKSRYGFRTTLLLNADRYALLSAINKLREELGEKDNLLIYYAGHGALDEVNKRGYWLPIDAEPESNANWIPSWQITDLMNAMNAGQIMLVADSCYSGTLTTAAIPALDDKMSDAERDRWYQTMTQRHARVVLTSGGVQPVLDGGGGKHSVFAAAFIKALKENRGVLEGQRLASEITGDVTVAAEKMNFKQVPMYAPIRYAGHEAGDFFFVPKG